MKMFINGKRVDAKDNAVIEVLNSATQELVDTVPELVGVSRNLVTVGRK